MEAPPIPKNSPVRRKSEEELKEMEMLADTQPNKPITRNPNTPPPIPKNPPVISLPLTIAQYRE